MALKLSKSDQQPLEIILCRKTSGNKLNQKKKEGYTNKKFTKMLKRELALKTIRHSFTNRKCTGY